MDQTSTDSIRPVRGTLLVKLDEQPRTAGGLYIPDNAKVKKERCRTGTILRVGEVDPRDPQHPEYLAEFAEGVRIAYEPMSEHSLSEHASGVLEQGVAIVRMDRVQGIVDSEPGEFTTAGEELS